MAKALGNCPECGTAIRAPSKLIVYETSMGERMFAECSDCMLLSIRNKLTGIFLDWIFVCENQVLAPETPDRISALSLFGLNCPLMVEHCDKCGTELDEDQARHQQYWIENADDSEEISKGRLCSDCFWEFREWLNEPE